jgi:hypothetical protein
MLQNKVGIKNDKRVINGKMPCPARHDSTTVKNNYGTDESIIDSSEKSLCE